MREIKFRAWDKINKRMCRVGRIEWSIDDYFVVWIEWDEKDEHREELRNLSQVDIMQYTGLKDKYGKEIYEGDIILYQVNDNYKCKATVNWSKGGFVFMWQDKTSPSNLSDFWFENTDNKITEVIGNVYESNIEELKCQRE